MPDNYLKDPSAVLDYVVDWGTWMATGDTITTSEFIAETGITVDSDDHDDTTATVWLSGGTVGEIYEVTNRITTDQGRTDDRTIRIFVHER